MPYYIEGLSTYAKKILKCYKIKEKFDDANEAWACAEYLSAKYKSANFTVYKEEVTKNVKYR